MRFNIKKNMTLTDVADYQIKTLDDCSVQYVKNDTSLKLINT